MNEPKRIQQLFEKLYDGNPWLDVTLAHTLEDITAGQAARKTHPTRNSIWELTNHLVSWRENVLKRVSGDIMITPEHNYLVAIEDTSEAAWKQTLENLRKSQDKWIKFLSKMSDKDLNQTYPPNGHTHYEHIHGIIQHDCYHLGQIVLLAKHPD